MYVMDKRYEKYIDHIVDDILSKSYRYTDHRIVYPFIGGVVDIPALYVSFDQFTKVYTHTLKGFLKYVEEHYGARESDLDVIWANLSQLTLNKWNDLEVYDLPF